MRFRLESNKVMLHAALAKMADAFPTKTLNLGYECQCRGYVLNVRLSDGLVKARVKDESNRIYNVHLDLKRWPATPAQCGCSYHHANCEHVAACLFELKKQSSREVGEPPNAPVVHAREPKIIDADNIDWYSDVKTQGLDFFTYYLGIIVDGQRVNIVPLIIDLISRWDEKHLDDLSDDVMLKLSISPSQQLNVKLGRIKPLLRVVMQYSLRSLKTRNELAIQRHQLLLMIEAEQAISTANKHWRATHDLRDRLKQFINVSSLPNVAMPQGLNAKLRDYQHIGLNWLQSLTRSDFGGILADDMGLGKTIQTLSHLLVEKEQGRLQGVSLIITPTSLVRNWYDEIKRFTPKLKALVYHGNSRHLDAFDDYDVVISTYGLIHRDKKRFLNQSFYCLILDEAQYIKNTRSKTAQMISQLNAQHRLCLSGTPVENHLSELWSLFNFLMPGFLGSARYFRKWVRIPIEKHGDIDKKQWLAKRIQPFLLRRTKKEVAQELPLKTVMTRTIELTGSQRDLYEAIRLGMEKKVRDAIAQYGLGKSQIVLLDALLKLRQVCCDPRLLSLPGTHIAHGCSVKLNALMELLDGLLEEGRRVLVFSQFTSMLALIEQECQKRAYPYLILTGQTKRRHEVVCNFQEGLAPLFLISLKAGGVGLNLTRADTVIHYDPWWNPAVEDQATDRSHRIGQKDPVFVYKLIISGSVEEAILRMQENKRALMEGILSTETHHSLPLSEEDIDSLFMPLS